MLNNNIEIPKSLVEIQRDYIKKILASVKGLKCLVLDEETTKIVSLVYLQSEAFENETFLFDKLENLGDDKLNYLNAVFIISGKKENFWLLEKELEKPKFKEYYIYFTTNISDEFIRKLAEIDEFDVIKSIQRIYFHYFSINEDVFHLDFISTKSLNARQDKWGDYEKKLINKMEEGIINVLLSLRKLPTIRYLNNSLICKHLSDKINTNIRNAEYIFSNEFDKNPTSLLILERKEDPFTPLVINWSYQSLLHELIKIDYNSIEVNKTNYNLFLIQDEFYSKNKNSIFGELANNLKENIEKMTKKQNSQVNLKEFEDIQRLMNEMPDIKKSNANLTKHINLTGELNRQITKRKLMDISTFEQNLLTKDDKKNFSKELKMYLNMEDIDQYDKIRLLILFCLKYEDDDISKEILIQYKKDLDTNLSLSIDNFLKFYSQKNRKLNIFNLGFTDKAKNYFKDVFKNTPNVYEQYSPYVKNIIEDLMDNNLKENDFPFSDMAPNKEKPQTIIIFVIGGITYSEAKEISDLNKKYPNISFIIGGTNVLNSKLFLSEFIETN